MYNKSEKFSRKDVKRNFKQGGITLVALIITIIVLLILAGVVFSILGRENGLLQRVTEARDVWERAEANEEDVMLSYQREIAKHMGEDVPIPDGFRISSNIDEDERDEGLVIIGPDDSEFVWVPVPNVEDMYDVQNGKQVGKLNDFGLDPASVGSEPSVVSGAGYDTNEQIAEMEIDGVDTKEDFEEYLQTEFDNMIASVRKYKGFYIGRYETGNLSIYEEGVVSKKDLLTIDNYGATWYVMYKKQREMYEDSTSVVSGMIWGSQWDATLRWLQNFEEETEGWITDSSAIGHYMDVDPGRNPYPTGVDSNWKIKNIYDMAGNAGELTMEFKENGRVERRR